MIKFFRKIRQQLLTANKFSKYLLYAIGEIFLVVIGILIALQLNNLNENRKTHEKEHQYLIALQGELESNIEEITSEKAGLNSSLESQRKIIKIISNRIDTISEIHLSNLFNSAFSRESSVSYINGVFTELLNSGNLNTISNDSIRFSITSWEGIMIGIRNQENEYNTCRNKITDFLIDSGDFKGVMDDNSVSEWVEMEKSDNNSNKSLLKVQKFENLIAYQIVLGVVLDELRYSKLENEINELLVMVKRELDERKTKG